MFHSRNVPFAVIFKITNDLLNFIHERCSIYAGYAIIQPRATVVNPSTVMPSLLLCHTADDRMYFRILMRRRIIKCFSSLRKKEVRRNADIKLSIEFGIDKVKDYSLIN